MGCVSQEAAMSKESIAVQMQSKMDMALKPGFTRDPEYISMFISSLKFLPYSRILRKWK